MATPSPVLEKEDFERKVVGLLLAIGGNLLISISLNLQKWVHRQNLDEHYTKVPQWWYTGLSANCAVCHSNESVIAGLHLD